MFLLKAAFPARCHLKATREKKGKKKKKGFDCLCSILLGLERIWEEGPPLMLENQILTVFPSLCMSPSNILAGDKSKNILFK